MPRILIADDQPDVITALRLLLKGEVRDGSNVNVAYDAGHDALRFVSS